jgi:DNA-directed RNA polymerase specialized sigma24 family protein
VRTWLFRVLVNIAKTRGVRERRSTPYSALEPWGDDGTGPTVGPGRFRPDGDPWPHHWVEPPQRWEDSPEHRLLSGEVLALVHRELDRLPDRQRVVVTLRDMAGVLRPPTRAAFEEHLRGCESYLEQMRTTLSALGRIPVGTVPPEARARLMSAFRGWSAQRES